METVLSEFFASTDHKKVGQFSNTSQLLFSVVKQHTNHAGVESVRQVQSSHTI